MARWTAGLSRPEVKGQRDFASSITWIPVTASITSSDESVLRVSFSGVVSLKLCKLNRRSWASGETTSGRTVCDQGWCTGMTD